MAIRGLPISEETTSRGCSVDRYLYISFALHREPDIISYPKNAMLSPYLSAAPQQHRMLTDKEYIASIFHEAFVAVQKAVL